MTAEQFEAMFFDSIRVVLNWHALRREEWPVVEQVVTKRKELGELLTTQEKRGQLMRLGAEHMTVQRVCERFHRQPNVWRGEALRMSNQLLNSRPSAWVLPAIDLGHATMLLDGAHRCVASYLSGVMVPTMLCVLEAPQDAYSLIDAEAA